ncbi:3-keto-5-aminohexanoate cleavage protein [Rhodococcus sp. MEB032]|uniref:3-keto-5-aminohexanoate cleavage protein n=1 Tax=Rhodococcus sp. MEB032 TaxID=3040322 RepID=UPI00254EFB72|nr:3-keto-5-aminohexanoate cleavage protein [Rhodococcus sp. MEB032]
MRHSPRVIVSCALTGGIHTPSMSAGLPVTAQEMIEQGIGAVESGAAILHLHARDPADGRPDPRPETYKPFVTELHEKTDAILNITTGGSTRMSVDDRLAAAKHFQPELASLNLGSMNFVYSGAAKRDFDWQYPWEREYLLQSEDTIFSNTFRQIESTLQMLGKEAGTKFEFECYDVGHLYTLAYFADRGLVEPPFFVQTVLGVLGGIGPDLDNLLYLVRTADRLFGDDYYLSAFGAGKNQIPVVTQSMLLGGNVRVGLEDNLFIGKGEMAPNNAAQVDLAVSIMQNLGLQLATPDEVRNLLGLKGKASTKFGRP